jgi:hypothetical protein
MVVFSLQTFINTFFYVQSSGRARRTAQADGGSRRPLRPTVGGAVGEAVRRSRLPTATGRPKRRMSAGAVDAGHPDA